MCFVWLLFYSSKVGSPSCYNTPSQLSLNGGRNFSRKQQLHNKTFTRPQEYLRHKKANGTDWVPLFVFWVWLPAMKELWRFWMMRMTSYIYMVLMYVWYEQGKLDGTWGCWYLRLCNIPARIDTTVTVVEASFHCNSRVSASLVRVTCSRFCLFIYHLVLSSVTRPKLHHSATNIIVWF